MARSVRCVVYCLDSLFDEQGVDMGNGIRKWLGTTAVIAASVGGIAIAPSSVGAGNLPTNFSVGLSVTKVLDGQEVSDWPIIAEIQGDSGAIFSSTQTDVAPVEWDENGDPVLLTVQNLPVDGVTVLLREESGVDSIFDSYYCSGNLGLPAALGEIEVTVPVFTENATTPVSCTFYNESTIPLTIEARQRRNDADSGLRPCR